jgi:hypothetical protein
MLPPHVERVPLDEQGQHPREDDRGEVDASWAAAPPACPQSPYAAATPMFEAAGSW